MLSLHAPPTATCGLYSPSQLALTAIWRSTVQPICLTATMHFCATGLSKLSRVASTASCAREAAGYLAAAAWASLVQLVCVEFPRRPLKAARSQLIDASCAAMSLGELSA